jgi:hypothetical protein
VLALEFFGGVPRLIVPDQTLALIMNPCSYDPQNNRVYEEFAAHYGCALLAARPMHPRDKPKVENSVLVVERWILACLRNRKFFSLMELNHAIALLLNDLNARAFKKLPGNRRSAFEQLDLPALRPLPAKHFELFRWKSAKVNIDYHVEFEGHYYSVPHNLVRTTVCSCTTGGACRWPWQGPKILKIPKTVIQKSESEVKNSSLRVRPRRTSSTLPARKCMIPLETDFKAQTTKQVSPGRTGSAVSTPVQQTTTSGRG